MRRVNKKKQKKIYTNFPLLRRKMMNRMQAGTGGFRINWQAMLRKDSETELLERQLVQL